MNMLFYERKLRDHWGENPFNFHLPGATSKFIETILKTPSPGTEFSKDFFRILENFRCGVVFQILSPRKQRQNLRKNENCSYFVCVYVKRTSVL